MSPADAARAVAPILDDPRLAFLGRMREAFPSAEWFLVGGAVRDLVLGRSGTKDIDLVARKVGLEELSRLLAKEGDVNYVGRNFGVLKFRPRGTGDVIDIAWPRTERAGMTGAYRDFAVQSDPDLPIERDLARRDFAMNAMAFDLVKGELLDPYGGLADIEAKTVRAVGDAQVRFAEDHSRMLRAVRFACQLGFVIEPATWDAIARRVPHLHDLREDGERVVPYETIAKEFVKAMAADPARAVELFHKCGALFRLVPELASLSSCAQTPEHHAEGDVWTHTMLALAKLRGPEFAGLFPGEAADAETAIAVLLHDVAKPQTFELRGGKATFYGHDEHGARIALVVAERLRLSSAGIDPERLAWLVQHHLFPNLVDLAGVRRTTLARYFLKDRLAGRRLLHLACADAAASLRPDGSADLGTLRALLATLREMEDREEAAPSLLTGDDVMAMTGMGPGPGVGKLLDALKEAQLRGEVADIDHAKELIRGLHPTE
ncbi:MAG TPA: HD domain-containing protein [Candidatus Binatia bacterium]|nr:HD domain-containing protein [Candidatus Binatia bacterium]